MPLNLARVGHTYPPTIPYVVGREKIREFASAIGATEAIHHDPDAAKSAGYPDVVAPLTFAIAVAEPVMGQIIGDEDLGLDFSRVVHGQECFAYARPIRAGDTLVCQCTLTEITERAGSGFLTARTEITTDLGELVATATSKLVVRA